MLIRRLARGQTHFDFELTSIQKCVLRLTTELLLVMSLGFGHGCKLTTSVSAPNHRALAMEDQISLLKGATFEMMQIRFNMLFNDKTGIWECGPLHYCMDDASRGEAFLLSYLLWLLLQPSSRFSGNRRSVLKVTQIFC